MGHPALSQISGMNDSGIGCKKKKKKAKYMLNKSDNAMHRTAVKAFLIKFAPRKSQQIFF